ncbi:hypothetical protein CYMTET_39633 [Cymbomonas tetramitiformis]|uniref:EF-hand domain-containing protein n=1 Tax=Cymbomonas tetramitiformis TaxID=36881 RepID=A0AAE0CBX9_9CHLO|nr:hypothetical protein CYMTET_39633 [Cymbomonas tetramitiformis]
MSVQNFFEYTEEEGRRFFKELDQDADGRVTLEDLKVAMRRRNLPERYANLFMRRAKASWFRNSIGWEEFRAVMGEKEHSMLRTFNSMNVTLGGALRLKQVKASLESLGLPATDKNTKAMMRYLCSDENGYISYGNFRNFLMLLPSENTLEADAQNAWYEAATFVPMQPPETATGGVLLKAAIAGALTAGSTTGMMHPLDTVKTRVQAAVGSAPSPKEMLRTMKELVLTAEVYGEPGSSGVLETVLVLAFVTFGSPGDRGVPADSERRDLKHGNDSGLAERKGRRHQRLKQVLVISVVEVTGLVDLLLRWEHEQVRA